jgi:hypothetical protein
MAVVFKSVLCKRVWINCFGIKCWFYKKEIEEMGKKKKTYQKRGSLEFL